MSRTTWRKDEFEIQIPEEVAADLPADFTTDAMRIMGRLAHDWKRVICTPFLMHAAPVTYLPLWEFVSETPLGDSSYTALVDFPVMQAQVHADPHLYFLRMGMLGMDFATTMPVPRRGGRDKETRLLTAQWAEKLEAEQAGVR